MLSSGQCVVLGGSAVALATAVVLMSRNKSEQQLGDDVQFLVSRAKTLQRKEGCTVCSLDHLMAAINETPGAKGHDEAANLLGNAPSNAAGGLSKNDLEDTLRSVLGGAGAQANSTESALDRFTIDLTQRARQSKLDPVIGRDEELRRIEHILSRRTKNNPVLVGETGVGKTVIVEGLAQRILSGDVPYNLRHCRIVSLDIGSLTAGAMMPGEYEDRLKAILEEVASSNGRTILFIDDIHNLLPSVGQPGSTMLDGGALLKPFLSRGELLCIGACTVDKFKKTIEKDSAFERCFQKVTIDQPSVETTISILRGLRSRYETHHRVEVREDALQAAATLSHRYISGRLLPDKAIDVIDEAAAQVKIASGFCPNVLDSLKRQIVQLKSELGMLEAKAINDRAAAKSVSEVRTKLSALRNEEEKAQRTWDEQRTELREIQELESDLSCVDYQIQMKTTGQRKKGGMMGEGKEELLSAASRATSSILIS
nr:chaperone protein (clpB2) [Polytomella parva]